MNRHVPAPLSTSRPEIGIVVDAGSPPISATGSRTFERLNSHAFWEALLVECEDHQGASSLLPERLDRSDARDRSSVFRELVVSGQALAIVGAFGRQEYEPSMPRQVLIAKAGGKKKTIYTLPPADTLFFKGINRYLQDVAAADISPLCHSFQRGRGVQSVLTSLLRNGDPADKYCLRLDVTDYFNSIRVTELLRCLPRSIRGDAPLLDVLQRLLLCTDVLRAGRVVRAEQKGVMAGTPLSCLLSNLYLKDLDEAFRRTGITYARYSDDIIVFADKPEIDECERFIRSHLQQKGLRINEEKSRIVQPGEPWEYLGLRYHQGTIDLSDNTVRKVRAKIRRQSHIPHGSGQPGRDAAESLIRRLNRKFYGWGAEANDFNWATWFFPVLTSATTLKMLDHFIQEKIRRVATGTVSLRNRKLLPYTNLQAMGYVPLTAAYFAMREGESEYRRMLSSRLALLAPAPDVPRRGSEQRHPRARIVEKKSTATPRLDEKPLPGKSTSSRGDAT